MRYGWRVSYDSIVKHSSGGRRYGGVGDAMSAALRYAQVGDRVDILSLDILVVGVVVADKLSLADVEHLIQCGGVD